jgi:hypothetical protein
MGHDISKTTENNIFSLAEKLFVIFTYKNANLCLALVSTIKITLPFKGVNR